MIKYLLLGLGILYASKVYAKRIKTVNEKTKIAAKAKENLLDSYDE